MPPRDSVVVARNRRARHDYDILETLECGVVLQGSEVKALREGKAQIAEAHARVERGELWLHGVHVPPYASASGFGAHLPERPRKLLAHRDEIEDLAARMATQRLSLVPLALYFRDGRLKCELALVRGRRHADKRQAIAERDAAREAERAMARARKGRYGH